MLISEQIERHVVQQLNPVVEIVEVFPPIGTTQRVRFCNPKWVKLYAKLENLEIIQSVGEDIVFQLVHPFTPLKVGNKYTLQTPLFFNGTLSNTKFEWARFELKERNKLPFIWLESPTEESDDPSSNIKTSSMRLWFVHWSDWEKLNKDRQSDAIQPLMRLQDEFVHTMYRQPHIFNKVGALRRKDFPKFGTETANGVEKTIFDSTLSAVKIDVDVDIFKHNCGKC